MEMTMIEALEKLAHLNEDGFETLVKTNAGEPHIIEYAIEDVRNYAEDPDEIFDLHVTEETIQEFDENGYIKTGEPLYRVVHGNDDNHGGMSEQEWTKIFMQKRNNKTVIGFPFCFPSFLFFILF